MFFQGIYVDKNSKNMTILKINVYKVNIKCYNYNEIY